MKKISESKHANSTVPNEIVDIFFFFVLLLLNVIILMIIFNLLVDMRVEAICDFLRIRIIGFMVVFFGLGSSLLPVIIVFSNVGMKGWDDYNK